MNLWSTANGKLFDFRPAEFSGRTGLESQNWFPGLGNQTKSRISYASHWYGENLLWAYMSHDLKHKMSLWDILKFIIFIRNEFKVKMVNIYSNTEAI